MCPGSVRRTIAWCRRTRAVHDTIRSHYALAARRDRGGDRGGARRRRSHFVAPPARRLRDQVGDGGLSCPRATRAVGHAGSS